MLIRLLRNIWMPKPRKAEEPAGTPIPQQQFSPAVFHTGDIDRAKYIILTPTRDMTTDERWEIETRNVAEELGRALNIDPESRILDYGYGIGRIAKALIDRYGCSVVGVDISEHMRKLSLDYVNSDRFSVCDAAGLDQRIQDGYRATGAYACWVLQHCHRPADEIGRIHAALVPGAPFFVLNSNNRLVPTENGWASDDISIEQLLIDQFEPVSKFGITQLVVSRPLANQSWGMLLRKSA